MALILVMIATVLIASAALSVIAISAFQEIGAFSVFTEETTAVTRQIEPAIVTRAA